MTKTVLITGITGMLGCYIDNFVDRKKYQVFCPTRQELDLKNTTQIDSFVKKVSPNFILHLAAETNVDLCEQNIEHAALINCTAVEAVAKAASEVGAWMAYISTSNVFGARGKMVYNELDLPDPENYYGRSKLLGEHMMQKHLKNFLIVRAGWMIGGGPARDQKFVGKIIKQIKNGESILYAVDDKYGNVTVAASLASFILRSMENERAGTFHFASKGLVTRFDIARLVAKSLNFSGEVLPVKSSKFPLPAPRANSEGISSVFLNEFDGIGLVESDVIKYVAEFQNKF
jgi:dTDP-4-dehydrorhamnose reductase